MTLRLQMAPRWRPEACSGAPRGDAGDLPLRPPTPTVVLEGARSGGAALQSAPWRCLEKAPWGCRRRSGGEGEIALSVLAPLAKCNAEDEDRPTSARTFFARPAQADEVESAR